NDEGVEAVLTFLGRNPVSCFVGSDFEREIMEANPFMSIKLHDEDMLVCERPAVVRLVTDASPGGEKGFCLVSGETDSLAKLQPAIKGVRGTNTTGGNIVSFNLSAFNSYGKLQGGNAPIGEK